MPSRVDQFSAIKLIKILMKFNGLWYTESPRERLISNVALINVIVVMIVALFTKGMDFFFSLNDLIALTYNVPAASTVLSELIKLLILTFYRPRVQAFNEFTDKFFWKTEYPSIDRRVLKSCNIKSFIGCMIYCLIAQVITWHYITVPIVVSVGKNVSERLLIHKLWINFPFQETPYYELTLAWQILATICVCLCTSTFTSYVYTVNNFAAGQFKILHRKLEASCTLHLPDGSSNLEKSHFQITSHDARTNLRNCLERYRLLIDYMKTMESLCSFVMLTQSFSSVLQMCFSGFQIMLGMGTSRSATILSIEYCTNSILQIFMFASSCDEIIVNSTAVAEAILKSSWYSLPWDGSGKAFRQELLILVCRARRPCVLTVGKFCPMSMETFKSILSTAASYFTVLRQVNESKSADH